MIYEGQAKVIRNEIIVGKLKLNKVLFKTKLLLGIFFSKILYLI